MLMHFHILCQSDNGGRVLQLRVGLLDKCNTTVDLSDVKDQLSTSNQPTAFDAIINDTGDARRAAFEQAPRAALWLACALGDIDGVDYTITLGASVSAALPCRDGKHRTPLDVALDAGHADVVRRLLQLGAGAMRTHTLADVTRALGSCATSVMLFGKGGAGKTQLSRYLREYRAPTTLGIFGGNTPPVTERGASANVDFGATDGVEVASFSVDVAEGMKVVLFDFAGQDVYKHYHVILFNNRAL